MRAYQRLLRYVQIHTTSNPENSEVLPSTPGQFDLAHLLVEEMKAMGISNASVDESCYVYGSLAATPGCESAPAIGFIAHVDTAYDCSGEGVTPLIHENYDGGDLHLPTGHVISPKNLPGLAELKGRTLITASGDTLLGADDKAGIAEILTLCQQLIEHNLPHGTICIGFTPDEEIGNGPKGFDVAGFGADYAYTVDGAVEGEIEYESFNAASAEVTFRGVVVHPGGAKGIMVNASKLAMEFQSLLPQSECPEETEGREGFFHLSRMSGGVESACLNYIVRDHDRAIFEQRKKTMETAAEEMCRRYGAGTATLVLKDTYYNMGEVIEKHFHLVENAKTAIIKAGLTPIVHPIRGGTDGSQLSFMGLPCPNLGTGGYYFHGRDEFVTVEGMDQVVEVLHNIVSIYSAIAKE